ncbi:conserved membrane hypothetical protein [Frankia canadensis]|uniref:Membrane-anchored protein n=1 Tax=Frankia canadensis TaxID=1836972 RepID=A0A2I2KXN9_9ACTN|nr:hypothetical protein [Frankia canadensis]SNQ50427.1 conserved membrane hypothetical protein [Frankia canadensis]SOU57717.1 conserved membrane hypothetical protein [Frankia canadensis]
MRSLLPGREPLAPKVPQITALFWIIKVLSTGMGEATADWLAGISLVLAAAVGLLGFAAAMWLQLRARRYQAWIYWFAVVMLAVFGTMAADGPPIGHLGSAVLYALVLAVVLVRWRRAEGTLSIHSIVTRRREAYYWSTVLATFALGTALGDVTAGDLHLGYLPSGLLFAGVITLPVLARRWGVLGEVGAFWAAYIVTRPLGASFADWLGKPARRGGVGLGDGTVAAVATVLIVALVAWAARASARSRAGAPLPSTIDTVPLPRGPGPGPVPVTRRSQP